MINASYCLVRDIHNLLERNWEVNVTHTYMEDNRCADAMANHALSLPQRLHILGNPSGAISRIMTEDIAGISFHRRCIF